MRRYLSILWFAVFLSGAGPSLADDPVLITNPEDFSATAMHDLASGKVADVATRIAEVVGRRDQATVLTDYMKPLEGKHANYYKKVVDKDFSGALRQIVHYAYMPEIGFVYFRFNFKQTGNGWILANFKFVSEVQELFPLAFESPY